MNDLNISEMIKASYRKKSSVYYQKKQKTKQKHRQTSRGHWNIVGSLSNSVIKSSS